MEMWIDGDHKCSRCGLVMATDGCICYYESIGMKKSIISGDQVIDEDSDVTRIICWSCILDEWIEAASKYFSFRKYDIYTFLGINNLKARDSYFSPKEKCPYIFLDEAAIKIVYLNIRKRFPDEKIELRTDIIYYNDDIDEIYCPIHLDDPENFRDDNDDFFLTSSTRLCFIIHVNESICSEEDMLPIGYKNDAINILNEIKNDIISNDNTFKNNRNNKIGWYYGEHQGFMNFISILFNFAGKSTSESNEIIKKVPSMIDNDNFLQTADDIGEKILHVINTAKELIIIASPYIKITNWTPIKDSIARAIERGVKVELFTRGADETGYEKGHDECNDIELLKEMGCSIYLIPDFHAKMYANEKFVVQPSMNLHEHSYTTNIEIGSTLRMSDSIMKRVDFWRETGNANNDAFKNEITKNVQKFDIKVTAKIGNRYKVIINHEYAGFIDAENVDLVSNPLISGKYYDVMASITFAGQKRKIGYIKNIAKVEQKIGYCIVCGSKTMNYSPNGRGRCQKCAYAADFTRSYDHFTGNRLT